MTRSMNFRILLMLSVFASISSCKKTDSSDVEEEVPIFQDYFVRYDKTSDTTVAMATFKTNDFSGDRLILTGQSSVSCNNEIGEYNSNVTNYFYRWESDGYVDCSFEYTKDASRIYYNTIGYEERSEISFPDEIASFSLSETTTYAWEESPLQPGESITFFLSQGQNSGSVIYNAQVGLEGVEIGPSSMSSLSAGQATLHVSRCVVFEELDQEDDSAGGRRVIEVKITKEVLLVD